MSDPVEQIPNYKLQEIAKHLSLPVRSICTNCGSEIRVMSFRGTGVCCELCRKDRDGDHGRNHAIIEAPMGGERKAKMKA